MTAILGGFGAALCWAVAMLTSSRASRLVGPGPVLAWVMLIALVITVPFVAVTGSVPAGSVGYLLLAGTGSVVGLLLEYTAVRTCKVGIVVSITSTVSAVTATIVAIAGEAMSRSDSGVGRRPVTELDPPGTAPLLQSTREDGRVDEGVGLGRCLLLNCHACRHGCPSPST